MPTLSLRINVPLNLRRTMLSMKAAYGRHTRVTAREAWRASRTPFGGASLHVRLDGGVARAEAWGPGADWMLDSLPRLLGLADPAEAFDPGPGIVGELKRRQQGLRIGRTDRVFEVLLPTILGQKVTAKEAIRGYHRMTVALSEPAPGPVDLWLPASADRLASLRYDELHPWGVERKRAVTVIEAARRVKRLEEAERMDYASAWKRLTAIRGVGPWTAGHVLGIALGDPDAVPVGDFHTPNHVAWVLAGEPRADDARMLELLEPFRGNRRRVLLLIKGSGIAPPKFGPRHELRSIERI